MGPRHRGRRRASDPARRGARLAGVALLAAVSLLALDGAALATGGEPAGGHDGRRARFATFNASLNRAAEGQLIADLSTPGNAQAQAAAETIQRVRPDVLLINEFDFDAQGRAARLFQRNYLSVGHNGAAPIHYPFRFVAPSNTGIPSGFDLDNNGTVGGPNDAFGFGAYPGQFGMAVYSRFPILRHRVRTFQRFLWKDMPGALLPDDPATPAPADWYSPEELAVFRLSSKSHWDVPVLVGGEVVHALVSHPTPPVFDGPEDRNGTRNFDEIRLWADYVVPSRSRYLYDDQGRRGGLARGASFVIMGDQNSDPLDGDSIPGAAQQLLEHPRVNTSLTPSSPGGPEQAALQGGANLTHRSDPAFDTADFADVPGPGNLRADYVLPSRDLRMLDARVFWPLSSDPLFRLVGVFPFPTSDHRLVWADLRVGGARVT
jgi:Endonuclease/Exonuclease/phosphatase family